MYMFCRSLFVFRGVRVTRSLVLCVCFVDRCLFLAGFNQNGILPLICAGKHEKKPLIHSLKDISFMNEHQIFIIFIL